MALATHPILEPRRLVAVAPLPRATRQVTQALIAHGAAVVRAGLSSLLTSGAAYDVAHAPSVFEAFRMSTALRPQVVLFDFSAAGGAAACRLFAALWPRPRLVALVSHGRAISARECLEAGADAAVAIESVTRDSFLVAVRRAVDGEGPVAAGFPIEPEPSAHRTVDSGPLSALTPREREILFLIGEGLSNADIADLLVLSVKTVEAHRANLSRKLNVRSRAGLIRLAMTGGRS